jgi:hypothetical protein
MNRLPSNAPQRRQPLGGGEAVLEGGPRGCRGYRQERLLEHQGRWSG